MKYHTLVADPPWPYRDTQGPVGSANAGGTTKYGAVSIQVGNLGYERMSLKDILTLPVRDVAETNAHLYLWTTNSFMEEAHEVVRAWGFEKKTIITWGKVYQDDYLRPSMKTGFYYRGATEHVLFCVRGSLKITGTWPTLFLWPRIGKHSRKPDAFYDLVEQASPGPYVELFAREHRFGWDVHGFESANTAGFVS